MMDEEEGRPSLDVAQQSGAGDGAIELAREELLLAAAEAAEAKASGEWREAAWREALARMLRGATALRSRVAAGAVAMLEEVQRERSLIAAEIDSLRAEASVLREEIEVLRAERDLCLALALEAGGAVARHLAQWRQLHGLPESPAAPSATSPGDMSGSVPDAVVASGLSDSALPIAGFATYADALSGAQVAAGASKAAPSLVLTVSALPGLLPLFDLERALGELPNVKSCSVRAVRADTATLDLALQPHTAPTIVAAELLGVPGGMLALESVAEQQIVVRFTPPASQGRGLDA